MADREHRSWVYSVAGDRSLRSADDKKMANRTVRRVKEEVSEDMVTLLKNQKQIKEWQAQLRTRLHDMEDAYLRETPFGNVVRGFEVEGGTRSRGDRGREINDEKERLFSGSSWQVYEERSLSHKDLNPYPMQRALSNVSAVSALSNTSGLSDTGPSQKKRKV
jgi:hypothetical protein